MSDRDRLKFDGEVVDSCHGIFKVAVTADDGSTNMVSCSLSGKVRTNSIRILPGDKVQIEVSEYEMTKGRITFRYK